MNCLYKKKGVVELVSPLTEYNCRTINKFQM